jgi:hypothetical protein
VPRWLGLLSTVCLLACMTTTFAQSPGSQISIYAVEGLALGTRIPFDSSAYREYKCSPSDQFDEFTWCQQTRQQGERRRSFDVTYSLLHSRDGSIVYINRYQTPAFFARNEAERDIQSYSQKLGESPRTKVRMPHRSGLDGILASWGNIVLEPLGTENRKAFAEGRRLGKGYYIDFIGNFDRSAKEGFPLYRISGGAGFIWAASFDQKGRGTLRLVAVDTSAFYSELIALPSETRDSISAGSVEVDPAAAERPSVGANIRQREEKAVEQGTAHSEAREEFETAKRDVQLAKTEIESLSAERARLKATVERLESDKIAAENKAQVMKSVAYGTFVIALMAIASSLFFVSRKKSIGPKWIGPEPIPIQVTGHSSLADDPLPFKWSDLKSVMARNRYKPEEIVALREVDVLVPQGQNMVDPSPIGMSEDNGSLSHAERVRGSSSKSSALQCNRPGAAVNEASAPRPVAEPSPRGQVQPAREAISS